MWHKASGLNEAAYKLAFAHNGDKVEYGQKENYPIYILGHKFKP